MPPDGNDWNEYRKYVIGKLECFDEIFTRLRGIEVEIAKLKIKAGVWGIIGGSIPVFITIAILVLRALLID